MVVFLNDVFPNLQGSTQDTDDFDLYEYLGDSWGLVLMHPGDFTPVCTTELGELAMMHYEFKNRNVKVCGFSCNSRRQHRLWIRDIQHVTGVAVSFPLFCDPTRRHAVRLGVLDSHGTRDPVSGRPLSVRGVYVLYPRTHEVALLTVYPNSTGRNMEEVLRAVDGLQPSHRHPGVVTPASWKPGQDVLVNGDYTDQQADDAFGTDGYRVVALPSEQQQQQEALQDEEERREKKDGWLKRHYLRFTKDPSKRNPK